MPKAQRNDEEATQTLVPPHWVERRLGIARPTRIKLEQEGKLTPVRLTTGSHRRYDRAEVEALATAGTCPAIVEVAS
jgi:hypothetical protein